MLYDTQNFWTDVKYMRGIGLSLKMAFIVDGVNSGSGISKCSPISVAPYTMQYHNMKSEVDCIFNT